MSNWREETKELNQKYLNAVADYETAMSENQQLKIQISAREEVCNRLEDNWNMLKEHLKNRYDNGAESISYRQVFIEIREAMQVLEIQQGLEQGSGSNE